MRFRKTTTTQRGSYGYNFYDDKGRPQPVEVRAGEDGVTQVMIKTLHSLDDAEVYNNIKNSRPKLSDEQKAANEEWEAAHPGETAPKNWNISIDAFDAAQDKSNLLEEIYHATNEEVSAEVERLREVVDTLTPKQQELYQLVIIEGYSLTDAAETLGTSIPNMHTMMERIKKQIKNKF